MKSAQGLAWVGGVLVAAALAMVQPPVQAVPTVSEHKIVKPVEPKFVRYLNVDGVYLGTTQEQFAKLKVSWDNRGVKKVDFTPAGRVYRVTGSVLFDRTGVIADWNYAQDMVEQALGTTDLIRAPGKLYYQWGDIKLLDFMQDEKREFSLWKEPTPADLRALVPTDGPAGTGSATASPTR